MFERYTEKARRVIFFARYEASQYGASAIESEHLLLGLLREDWALGKMVLGQKGTAEDIRKEIEGQITIGQQVSTSVEMPLSKESKHILTCAAEEADLLGHRHIGTEHLLLAMLREEKCLAARILQKRDVRLAELRGELAERSEAQESRERSELAAHLEEAGPRGRVGAGPELSLSDLMKSWSEHDAKKFASFFEEEGQFVDARGQVWSRRADIEKGAKHTFAESMSGASRGKIEEVKFIESNAAIVSIVWEKKAGGEKDVSPGFRMTLVLFRAGDRWSVVRAHVTEIQGSAAAS